MVHPLDGCREKVARAGDHLETLDRESRRFVEEQRYLFEMEPDPDTGEQVVRIRSHRQPPLDAPPRLGVIVGDILHNLRSALDHLIWQLAVIGTGPGERNQFPIFDTPEQFEQKRKWYLKGVRAEHRALIEECQPYKGGTIGRALTLIAHLNDIDKHRIVHSGITFGMTGPPSISFTNVRSAQITGRDITTLIDGAELYRISAVDIVDPSKTVEVQSQVRYSIAFGDTESWSASRADLLACRDTVSNIIERFRGEFVGQPVTP